MFYWGQKDYFSLGLTCGLQVKVSSLGPMSEPKNLMSDKRAGFKLGPPGFKFRLCCHWLPDPEKSTYLSGPHFQVGRGWCPCNMVAVINRK